jgi:hypothetical protein
MTNGFEIALPCSTIVGGKPFPVTIRLIALNQYRIYEGLIEGVPTEEMNRRIIEGAVRDAKETFGDSEPLLIPPRQEALDIGRDYPFGKPATLPRVQCIAFFTCLWPTPRGQAHDYSWMNMVWFQEQLAMPIDAEVLDAIKAVDWLKLATNSER